MRICILLISFVNRCHSSDLNISSLSEIIVSSMPNLEKIRSHKSLSYSCFFFSGWYDDCLLRKLPKTVGHYHYLVHCFLPVDVFCAGHIHEICRDMAPGSCWLFHDLHLSLWGLASWLVLSAIVAFLMNCRTFLIVPGK